MSKRRARNTFEEVPCIIAFDQSYARTGIAVCNKGKVVKAFSYDFKGIVHNNSAKRLYLQERMQKIINTCLKKYKPEQIVVLVERVRTYTSSTEIRIEVIKSHSMLVAAIVDQATKNGIKTFSVDTRAWKARVLGSSKPIIEPVHGVTNPQKFASVNKAIKLGFFEDMKIVSARKRNDYSLNDDMADAICMSLYPFTGHPYTLKLET